MTRKKSNVKALALAVTCAILAGGHIGLNPVYAADAVSYDSNNKVLQYEAPSAGGGTAATPKTIDKLIVNGVTIGDDNASGKIIASQIVGTDANTSVEINGVKFSNVGAITGVTSLTATGALSGATLGVTGAATLESTLNVTGKATLKDELQVDKKATFGSGAGSNTVINGVTLQLLAK